MLEGNSCRSACVVLGLYPPLKARSVALTELRRRVGVVWGLAEGPRLRFLGAGDVRKD